MLSLTKVITMLVIVLSWSSCSISSAFQMIQQPPIITACSSRLRGSTFEHKNLSILKGQLRDHGKEDLTSDLSPLTKTVSQQQQHRRDFLRSFQAGSVAVITSAVLMESSMESSLALVKGNAPPTSVKAAGGKRKCSNVEECQALAEQKEQQEREAAEASRTPAKKTASGILYRDEVEGPSGPSVKDGDEVSLYYKVLKLGKRSYDGLSGEGTVVFSRGYGLEDDEKVPGDKSFITTVGGYNNIAALNEAIIGMQVGGVRRFAVLPQKGWRKPTAACDGGPGGSGKGGELKTDYVVVPTATMVEQEACFDTTKQPFPITYAQQRRMAQRFDQSLIMEVQLAAINSS